MSGIVGSKLNIRGSGLVGSLGTDGQHLLSSGAGVSNVFETSVGGVSSRNEVINGGFVVNQEKVTSPGDDDYTIGDLFLCVHEGSGPTTSLQTSGGPQGDRNFIRLDHQANNQSGLVYFMTNDAVQDYIANGKISWSIKAKTTAATIGTIRMGIIKWNSTADSITSDVVGTWAQDGTDPTLATNWSYENTPADIDITTSWAEYKVENITVDSDTNNIGLFVWVDDGTITGNDILDTTEWQVNPGATANSFSSPPKSSIHNDVQWFLKRLDFDNASVEPVSNSAQTDTTTIMRAVIHYGEMRSAPTVTTSAAGTFICNDTSVEPAGASVATATIGRHNIRFDVTTSGLTTGRGCNLRRRLTDTTFIQFDSRL